MTNKELFKQAIAEAKTIREAALVNAKAALEETLTPHLQSMLASKLEEMAKDEDEIKEEIEEVVAEEGTTEIMDEELNLDEFLAELELEEGSDEEINEAKEEEESEEPTEDEESEEGEEETEDEDVSVADLSIEDLKDIIKDIVDTELEAEEAETAGDENAEDAMDMGDEMAPEAGAEDEINLEELLAELDALDENEATEDVVDEAKKEDDKDEMKEAIETIEALRHELNEVNLLNAKLLYVNKIFKSKNLSEDNKIKVINAFDKATTPNEAKLVFEALNESLDAKETKSVVKEGIIKGFASKPAGNAPSKQIVEINEHMARMQKLAGITKY